MSTRNTAVDVFGFGMLGYYLFVGVDPQPNENKFVGYYEKIRDAIYERFNPEWRFIPSYLADIVVGCTYDAQAGRIPFNAAVEAFALCKNLLLSDKLPSNSPQLLREIACRIDKTGHIEKDDFDRTIKLTSMDSTKSLKMSLATEARDIIVEIKMSKIRGEHDQRKVGKYLETARNRSMHRLRDFPFAETSSEIGQSRIDIMAVWKPLKEVDSETVQKISDTLLAARSELELS